MAAGTRTKGFSLVEVLISLAMMAALLASIAVALDASITSYCENEDIAAATQTSRSVLNRMMREVRTAEAVDCTSTQLTIIPSDQSGGLQQVQYEFQNGTLYYRKTVSGTTTSYVLLGTGDDVTVSDFSVNWELGQDWQDITCTKSVTVGLELLVGGKTFAVTTSAAPRRNQLY